MHCEPVLHRQVLTHVVVMMARMYHAKDRRTAASADPSLLTLGLGCRLLLARPAAGVEQMGAWGSNGAVHVPVRTAEAQQQSQLGRCCGQAVRREVAAAAPLAPLPHSHHVSA